MKRLQMQSRYRFGCLFWQNDNSVRRESHISGKGKGRSRKSQGDVSGCCPFVCCCGHSLLKRTCLSGKCIFLMWYVENRFWFARLVLSFSACNPEEKEGFGRAWRRNLETLAGTSVCFLACFPQLVGENCEFYGANRKICVPAQKTPTPFWSLLSGVDVLALLRNRFRIEESLLDVCQ